MGGLREFGEKTAEEGWGEKEGFYSSKQLADVPRTVQPHPQGLFLLRGVNYLQESI